MPRLIDLPTRDFVGRERERREFRNSVRYVLGKEPPPGGSLRYPQIFLLHGEGGMGKSALLSQFVGIARDEGMAESQVVVLDLAPGSYPTAEALAQKIAEAVCQANPKIDELYRSVRDRRDKLESRRNELKEQWEALRGSNPDDIKNGLEEYRKNLRRIERQQAGFGTPYEPVYLGNQADETRDKIKALTSVLDENDRMFDSFDKLLEDKLGAAAAALLLDERDLWQALTKDLYDLAEATPLLLALDTYELADQHDKWLRRIVLEHGSSRMMTIIAGRNRPEEAYRGTISGGLVRAYNLNDQTLQSDEVREYLRLRLDADPTDERVKEVLEISRGIPLAVEALGDQLAGSGDIAPSRSMQAEGLDRRGVVYRVTKRFLGDAKQRDERRIRALSLLLRPDRDLACKLWGCTIDEAQQEVSELANRFSFILTSYAPYEMHELVREFVRANTLSDGRKGFDWPTLAEGLRRALPVVDQRIARADQRIPDLDKRYADAEWRDATLDRLNILLWLSEDEDEAAKRLLLNRWIEAQYAHAKFAEQIAKFVRQMVDLATELAPKQSEWDDLIEIVDRPQNDQVHSQLYTQLKIYDAWLESRGQAILSYMRAQQSALLPIMDDDGLQRANDYIDLLEKGLDLDPIWHPIRKALIDAYSIRSHYAMQKGHYTNALADYDRLLKLSPDDPDILSSRGTAKNWLRDYTGAKADFELSLTRRPDDPLTLSSRGTAKNWLGDYTGALADYNHALRLRPNDPQMLTERGIVKARLRDYTGALADYDHSLALLPNDAYTYSRRGKAKFDSGDSSGALKDYAFALSIQSNHADTMYYMAGYHAKQSHSNAAPNWLARITGIIQHRSHNPVSGADAAIEWLDRAIALDKRIRDDARNNHDFDPIRADPRFVALVGDAGAE